MVWIKLLKISSRWSANLFDDDFAAEDLKRVIEVFHCENDSWSARQCLNFRAAVPQLGQELLYEAEFHGHVEVALDVHPVVERRSELLERMDSHLDLGLRDLEAAAEGRVLRVQRLHGRACDHLFNLV